MLNRLVYRLKQFLFAIAAKMSEEDKFFVRQYLDIKESALFFSLPEFEQKHAVVVARRMFAETKDKKGLDDRKIIRLGLLHDIGKAAIKMSLANKVFLVVLKRGIPPIYSLFAKIGESEMSFGFFRKFYVHKHHGLIGSQMLERIGESQDIIKEVAQHDLPSFAHDSYMKILDSADNSY